MREEKKREPGVHLTLISQLQYQTSNCLKRQVELANVHSAWVIANIQQPYLVATYFAGTALWSGAMKSLSALFVAIP